METLRTGDGLKLHLQRWPAPGQARGTVQIVHGLGEHIERYAALALALNAEGWHVVGHDQRGHGRSEGPRGGLPSSQAMLVDLAAVTDHLRGSGRHVLLGHSMGGLIAARFVSEGVNGHAARWVRDVDGLVLSSPALDLGLGPGRRGLLSVLQVLAPGLGLGNGLNPAGISRDLEVVRQYRNDPLVHKRITPRLVRFMLDAGGHVKAHASRWTTPTLLMWAGADRLVAPAGSAAFAAAAPDNLVTARVFPELYHEIFNEPEREQVVACLTDWLARL